MVTVQNALGTDKSIDTTRIRRPYILQGLSDTAVAKPVISIVTYTGVAVHVLAILVK